MFFIFICFIFFIFLFYVYFYLRKHPHITALSSLPLLSFSLSLYISYFVGVAKKKTVKKKKVKKSMDVQDFAIDADSVNIFD